MALRHQIFRLPFKGAFGVIRAPRFLWNLAMEKRSRALSPAVQVFLPALIQTPGKNGGALVPARGSFG